MENKLRHIIRKIFNENINIPIEIGDEILGGKFKNKKIKVKEIGKNDKGDITINRKPLLRFRIPKNIEENLLTEKLNDIDSDVDFIYDNYFKQTVDLISSGKKVSHSDFPKNITETSVLTADDCVKANNLNPCTIYINYGSNFYRPSNGVLHLSFNSNAINWLLDNDGDFKEALENLDNENQKQSFSKEFSEEKIKGSINHELLHWIDDTLNNRHLSKTLKKAQEIGTKDFKGIPFNSSKIEIQGQMGNIKQLYNLFKRQNDLKTWNSLRFMDLVNMSPTLNLVYRELDIDSRAKWIRHLMTRMHREGLLGDRMKYLN